MQGVELGPLEIQINSMQKSIEAEQQEIAELQQMWLRDQSELVRLSKEKEKQSQDVENLKKQLTILSQKKLRIEGQLSTFKYFWHCIVHYFDQVTQICIKSSDFLFQTFYFLV